MFFIYHESQSLRLLAQRYRKNISGYKMVAGNKDFQFELALELRLSIAHISFKLKCQNLICLDFFLKTTE